MLTIFENIADLIFPPRDTEQLIRNETTETVLHHYKPNIHAGVIALASYQNNVIHALIAENKYYENNKATKLLACLLIQHITSPSEQCIFIPIPLSKERHKSRGYNQVARILLETQKQLPIVVAEHILERTRNTPTQTSLNREARLQNLSHAFTVSKSATTDFGEKTIILIDDVVTTGATLHAARAALAPHVPPEKIKCVALAH